MIHPRTGTVLGKGKVLAIDGSAAAQRLATDIVNRIRSVRPPDQEEAPMAKKILGPSRLPTH
jgi:hypothetical protein